MNPGLKNVRSSFVMLCLLSFSVYGQKKPQNWQKLSNPTVAEMQAGFAKPQVEYCQTMDFGLGRNLTQEAVAKDLDFVYGQGIRAISIEGSRGAPEPYLSPGYMERVKMVVAELKKRGMHLWIIDEGQYPSGFAGGLISSKAPEFKMQGLVVSKRITLANNEKIEGQKLAAQVVSAVAFNSETQESKLVDVRSGVLNWPGMPGRWQITLAEHRFKTAVTRSANNPAGVKDTLHSLIDYLNPEATRKWMEFTHEQYKKYIGDEFGKTVLGFRGDEPEFGFTPWTPKLLEIFRQKKGYDIQPYLASFLIPGMNDEQKLAKADFWDVWSDLFRDNFFKVIGDWCAANGLEYMVHIDHEEKLMDLAKSEGDFFKTMRYVQVPGVDAIWHQIWYDNVADFPKLASSAAHMYGRPRSLSESFAAYTPEPKVNDVRWVVNEEMVRGINLFEYMHKGVPYIVDPAFIPVSEYSNRASWLLANGIPAAGVGVYCPTESMWMGNKQADSSLLAISKQLLEHQVDFDYVDRQGIATVFKLNKGGFTNLSGQTYSTILVPSADVLPGDVLSKLQAFSAQGGKVIFIGQLPGRTVATTFLDAKKTAALDWAKQVNYKALTSGFYDSLPRDVKISKELPDVKYLHRKWKNADMYFFFNEGTAAQDFTATLAGTGKVTVWDADSGTVKPAAPSTTAGSNTKLPLSLKGFETTFVVIER